eukprot:12367258-Alexandrium_andersonii.AAC.1
MSASLVGSEMCIRDRLAAFAECAVPSPSSCPPSRASHWRSGVQCRVLASVAICCVRRAWWLRPSFDTDAHSK